MDKIDSFRNEYSFLSNFWLTTIWHQGNPYPTAEHLYQSYKATNHKDAEHIRLSGTPGAAKKLGRIIIIREDWDDIKVDVMRFTIALKFNNKFLAKKLLETGDARLIEGNTWGDNFWGVCNGEGMNTLGLLLEEKRTILKMLNQRGV